MTQAEYYQSIIDNPNMDVTTKRRAMLALGREQGMTTADAAVGADAYATANPRSPALQQTQMDAFLYNYLGGAPGVNQTLQNTPIQADQSIQGIQGASATRGNNTVSPINDRMTAANGGYQPQGVVSATGPGSVSSIPVQQFSQMQGLGTNAMQGLLSQPQGGLLGAPQSPQSGMQALYPTYGQPTQIRHTAEYGPSARPWMTQGNDQAFGQMNQYLRSQQNPQDLQAPATLAAFDKWRQGILSRPEVAEKAQQIGSGGSPTWQVGDPYYGPTG